MDFHVAVPGPFTYLVHEHARSIVAIQELQQEVTSLLEFRDHVLEALPHLHARPFHSLTPVPAPHDLSPAPRPAPPAHALPSSRADSSPSKAAHHMTPAEGGRQQRPISSAGGGGGGGGGNSSSSSTGGGKSLSETHSNSAVADSGFSTDKAGGSSSMGKSSSSSAGEHLSGAEDPRWTSVEPDLPLGSAEDELWHLLDVIQRKGTRLRHELERAERVERERLSQPGGATATSASDPLSSPRPPHPAPSHAPRDYWPHSLPGPGDLLPPPPPPPAVGMAMEAEAWAAVERLRQDRQYLVGRVSWAEAEAAASHQRLVDLHGQLLALAGDKRRLEDQVRALRLDPRNDLNLQFVKTNGVRGEGPASAGGIVHSVMGGVNTVHIVTDQATHTTATTTTTSSSSTRPRRPSPAVTVSVAGGDAAEEAPGATGRGRGLRSASSVRLNADRDVVLPRVLKVPIRDRGQRGAAPREAPSEEEGRKGSDRVVIERERRQGRADGGFSMPVSLLKGARLKVRPDKQRISAILREKDVLELQRQLLTTVMETEVLRKQIETASEEWAGKTSEWEADHQLSLATIATLREENTRLKQQVEERPRVEQREVGVSVCPTVSSTSTMTQVGGPGAGEEATHTVHPGPNIKYDVVVHQEEARRTPHPSGSVGATEGATRKGSMVGVEKPPRRSREPRCPPHPAPGTPLSGVREAASEPHGGKDSLGRASGSRARLGLAHSGRGTPTGTPRSSPAPSITPRMCTARTTSQEGGRATPIGRSASGVTGRSTLGRRDSLKAAQANPKGVAKNVSSGAVGAGGQHKAVPPPCSEQSSVGQPCPVSPTQQGLCSPLALADLRSPSPPLPQTHPTPRTTYTSRPPGAHRERSKGGTSSKDSGRRLVSAGTLLHPVHHLGSGETGKASSTDARRVIRYTGQSPASPQELRLSHLCPGSSSSSPSSSPPASYSSYYDSINSDGHLGSGPATPTPDPNRLMQVEVAFEWSPVMHPQEVRYLPPAAQVWHPNHTLSPDTRLPAVTPWPTSPRVPAVPPFRGPEEVELPGPCGSEGSEGGSRPWPADSLEEEGAEFEAVGKMRSRLKAMNGAVRLKSVERPSVLAMVQGSAGSSHGVAESRLGLDSGGPQRLQLRHGRPRPGEGGAAGLHSDADLNSRVHQILARIAASAQ